MIISPIQSKSHTFYLDINYVLFNWKRNFLINTLETKLIQQIIDSIKGINEADGLLKSLSATLKSPKFIIIPQQLIAMKKLLIENMRQYNEDKTLALKKKAETQDSLATAAKGSAEMANLLGSQNTAAISTMKIPAASQAQSNQLDAQTAFMPLLAAHQASDTAASNPIPLIVAQNGGANSNKKALG